MLKLYTDAAVRGNPGPATAGILIVNHHKQVQLSQYLGVTDNHHAEFLAAIAGFQALKQHNFTQEMVAFYADSWILMDGLRKHYSKHYAPELNKLLDLQRPFPMVLNQWIPDRQNSGAHHLAITLLQKY